MGNATPPMRIGANGYQNRRRDEISLYPVRTGDLVMHFAYETKDRGQVVHGLDAYIGQRDKIPWKTRRPVLERIAARHNRL